MECLNEIMYVKNSYNILGLLMKYLVKMYQTNLIYFLMQLPQIIFKLFLTQVGFDGPMNVILRIRLMIQLCMLNLVTLSILIRSLYE